MLKGVDSRQSINFTSKYDTEEPKTTFVIKPLTGVEMLDMSTLMDGVINSEDLLKMLDISIKEIQNHPDTESMSKMQILENLDMKVLEELMTEITDINNVTEADKKKQK